MPAQAGTQDDLPAASTSVSTRIPYRAVLSLFTVTVGLVAGLTGDQELVHLGLIFTQLQLEEVSTTIQPSHLDPFPMPFDGLRIVETPLNVRILFQLDPAGNAC